MSPLHEALRMPANYLPLPARLLLQAARVPARACQYPPPTGYVVIKLTDCTTD
jgi:hypothetical protein